MLEPREEEVLARRWREHRDRSSVDRLITSHLRLVVKIANSYRGYGLPIGEVISEGNLGLVRAAERFDPDMGCRFATYATWWIKAMIRRYVLRSYSLVTIGTTEAQRRLFFNLRRAKGRISAFQDGDLHADQLKILAETFGIAEKDIVDMNRRLGGDVSLNVPMSDAPDSSERQDWLVDDCPTQEMELEERRNLETFQGALAAALNELDARAHHIFAARHLAEDPVTLKELGQELGLSCEGVRRIEVLAFEKVKQAVQRYVKRVHRARPPAHICSGQSPPRSNPTHSQRRDNAEGPHHELRGVLS